MAPPTRTGLLTEARPTTFSHSAGLQGVSLHRLCHTVATYLVSRGDLLQAQQRLGHRDASTTLGNYAHAMPLEDQAVPDPDPDPDRSILLPVRRAGGSPCTPLGPCAQLNRPGIRRYF